MFIGRAHSRVVMNELQFSEGAVAIRENLEDPIENGKYQHKAKPLLKWAVSERITRQTRMQVQSACYLGKQASPEARNAAECIKESWATTRTTTLAQIILPLYRLSLNEEFEYPKICTPSQQQARSK